MLCDPGALIDLTISDTHGVPQGLTGEGTEEILRRLIFRGLAAEVHKLADEFMLWRHGLDTEAEGVWGRALLHGIDDAPGHRSTPDGQVSNHIKIFRRDVGFIILVHIGDGWGA